MNKFSIFFVGASMLILNACTNVSEKEHIRLVFRVWLEDEIKKEIFIPNDSCNESYFTKNKKKIESKIMLPDSNKIKYFFSDFNNDKQLDGLITFIPEPCFYEGSNPVVLFQCKILVLSKDNNYVTEDKFFSRTLLKGIDTVHFDHYIHIDSVSGNYFFGICNRYRKEYFRGEVTAVTLCSEIPIAINYSTRELIPLNRKDDKLYKYCDW